MTLKVYAKQHVCIVCEVKIIDSERRLHKWWRDFFCFIRLPHWHIQCGKGNSGGCGWRWAELVNIKVQPITDKSYTPSPGSWYEPR